MFYYHIQVSELLLIIGQEVRSVEFGMECTVYLVFMAVKLICVRKEVLKFSCQSSLTVYLALHASTACVICILVAVLFYICYCSPRKALC